jgi:hypothetical protein
MAAVKLNLRCGDLTPTEATLRLRENHVVTPVAGKKIRNRARSLLIVLGHSRRRFARLKLSAHFLQARSKFSNLLFQFLNRLMLL